MTQGEYIKRVRKEVGYKQDEVALQIGLSRPSYGNIECDRQSISVETLVKLSQLLCFSITDFIKQVHGVELRNINYVQAKINRLEAAKSKIDDEIKQLRAKI
jgi:transcriptional regulator with XRE-family HTH domain